MIPITNKPINSNPQSSRRQKLVYLSYNSFTQLDEKLYKYFCNELQPYNRYLKLFRAGVEWYKKIRFEIGCIDLSNSTFISKGLYLYRSEYVDIQYYCVFENKTETYIIKDIKFKHITIQGQLLDNKTYKTMNRIRLTESQLNRMIRRCINEALNEVYDNGNWFETNDGQKGFIVGQGNDSSVDVMIDGDKNVTRNMPWNKLKSTGASNPRYNQYAKFMTSQQGKDYITRDKGWNEDDYNSHINHYNLKQYANESLERIVKQIVLEELNNH